MRLIKIIWQHGRAEAQKLINERKLVRFAFGATGEIVEGFLVHILGENHAIVEVYERRKQRSAARRTKVRKNARQSNSITKAPLS